MSIPRGAGAITSTPADLTRFIGGLLAGKLVKPATLQQMLALQDGYGAGLLSMPFNQQPGYGHFGSIDGYWSAFTYFSTEELTVTYCGSSSGYTVNDLLFGALAICLHKPYRVPAFEGPVLTAADLCRFTGTYTSTRIPLKISVTTSGTTLIAQATGQGAFPLTPVTKTQFTYAAGLTMDFNAATHTFTLHQGPNNVLFTRE